MNKRALDLEELERRLQAMQFVTPPIAHLWQPTRTPRSRRVIRALLIAAALVLLAGGLAVAATQVFPRVMGEPGCQAPTCGDDFQVTAGISGDPAASPFGFNVVVADRAGPERLTIIAQGLADEHPKERVIVWFFSEAAGQERHGFPLLPGPDNAAPAPVTQDAWLGTYDFRSADAPPSVQLHAPSGE